MRFLLLPALVSFLLATSARAQDVASGPDTGARVPELRVFDATGAHQGEEADYAAERKNKPTVYLLLDAEKFDRPMNRFMKALDGVVRKDFEGAYVVAVWLTGDADRTKELLPRVQQSVQYEATALTVFVGAREGPKGWQVNADARLTAVFAHMSDARCICVTLSSGVLQPKILRP